MDVIVYLILVFISGLFIGALARLALPGPDPMSIWETAAVGIGGSLVAGLVWWAITGNHNGGGILLSVVFAALIVYIIRRTRGGSLTTPGRY
jgi:uncharacterized membrane protein YeaQ/YmgE (transglycosylase-associated protein family)